MANTFDKYLSHLFSIFFSNQVPKEAKLLKLENEARDFFVTNFATARLVGKSSVIHNVECGFYSLKNAKFIVVKNLQYTEVNDSFNESPFEYVDLNPTIYLLAAKDLNLKVDPSRFSDIDVENKIRYQHHDDDYQGHDWQELSELTERLLVIKIPENSVYFDQDFEAILFSVLSYLEELKHLDFNLELLDKYRNVLQTPALTIKENIFLSFSSTHWKHSFLEVYRCVEAIYSLPWSLDIKDSLCLNIPARSVSSAVIEALSFRGREKSSLVQLLSKWPLMSESPILKGSFFNDIDKESSDLATKVGEKIYSLRNQLVHQFDVHKEINMSSDEYREVIGFLLDVCLYFYTTYSDDLLEQSA